MRYEIVYCILVSVSLLMNSLCLQRKLRPFPTGQNQGKLRTFSPSVKSGSSPGQSLDEFWIKRARTGEQRLA